MNKLPSLLDILASHPSADFVVPDTHQYALTKKYLLPYLSDIERELKIFRASCDQDFIQEYFDHSEKLDQEEADQPKALRSLKRYPLGFCRDIRDRVLEDIHVNAYEADMPGCQAIHAFQEAGGILKNIYVIRDQCFQNAIQAGALYIDAANDTAKLNDPALHIDFVETAKIRNISDYEDYAKITELYQGYKVYPNNIFNFPFLSDLFPIILIDDFGHITLGNGDPLLVKNLLQQRQLAYSFLHESIYKDRELPSPFIDALHDYFSSLPEKDQKRSIFQLRKNTDPPTGFFDRELSLSPNAFVNLYDCINNFNQQSIRPKDLETRKKLQNEGYIPKAKIA